jgi:hypothetical protein
MICSESFSFESKPGGRGNSRQSLTTHYRAKSSLTLYVLEMHGNHQSAIIRLT